MSKKLSEETQQVLDNLEAAAYSMMTPPVGDLRVYGSLRSTGEKPKKRFMLIRSSTTPSGVRIKKFEILAHTLDEAKRIADEQYAIPKESEKHMLQQVVALVKYANDRYTE
jgi:hypothetical protein